MRALSWTRGHWKAIAAAAVLFLAGVGVGAAGGTEDVLRTTNQSLSSEIERLKDSNAAALEDLEQAEAQVHEAEERADTADQRALEKARSEMQDELQARQAKLDERAAKLAARERKVRQRERAVAVVEQSSFGDGVYLVGEDIPAGSYIAPGSTDGCYWARLTQGSQDIIDNHFGAGQVRVTVNTGELFDTAGCGTWRRA